MAGFQMQTRASGHLMTAGGAYTVGIDVGTTFAAAAIRREGKAEVVTLGDRGDVIPSIAFLREDDVLLVGHAAERRAVSGRDPGRPGVQAAHRR